MIKTVIGIAILGWDRKWGALIDFKYPETLNLSDALINKIHMAHSLNEEKFQTEELIEIDYDHQIILSYCDKRKVASVGYEEVVLILDQKDKIKLESFKSKLMNFAREIIRRSKLERNIYAFENKKIFFRNSTEKKILILGRAGTGKSSIKEVVFEGKDPKDLIYNSLEPTRGITPSIHSWLDLNLGVFDSSGQELSDLLKDKNEQSFAFENSDVIIYLIDFPMWVAYKDKIIEEIKEIMMIRDKNAFNAKVYIFFHKIDLINKVERENELLKVKDIINDSLGLPVYFTSLYPELIYNMYNAFYEILAMFSGETLQIKRILDIVSEDLSGIMFYITNKNQSIISQTASKDFNHSKINHIHKLTAQLNQNFEDMCLNDNVKQLILVSENELKIYVQFLNLLEFDLRNVISVSETLDLNEIFDLTRKIMVELTKIYQK